MCKRGGRRRVVSDVRRDCRRKVNFLHTAHTSAAAANHNTRPDP
jgi:hypothetical protein